MLIAISILVLAYLIMGKDVKPLIERVKGINLRRKMNTLWDRLRPWALKAGRVASRPLLTFYYVMEAKETSTLDKAGEQLSLSAEEMNGESTAENAAGAVPPATEPSSTDTEA